MDRLIRMTNIAATDMYVFSFTRTFIHLFTDLVSRKVHNDLCCPMSVSAEMTESICVPMCGCGHCSAYTAALGRPVSYTHLDVYKRQQLQVMNSLAIYQLSFRLYGIQKV